MRDLNNNEPKDPPIEGDDIEVSQELKEGEGGDPVDGDTPFEPEEVTITLGDPPPEPTEEEQAHQQEQARPWVKELRKANKEKDRVIRELQAQVKANNQQTQAPELVLGKEPTLADHDYDEAAYSAALKKHAAQELEIAQVKRQKDEAANAEKTAWDAKIASYNQRKTKLGVSDFEDAEDVVKSTLSVTQQGLLIEALDNPEAMVYAIGTNPAKAKELATITNPVKFTVAVAKLETEMRITPKKSSAPPPERAIRGGASVTSTIDSKLEALYAEATRTNDISKVRAYKNQLRQKQ